MVDNLWSGGNVWNVEDLYVHRERCLSANASSLEVIGIKFSMVFSYLGYGAVYGGCDGGGCKGRGSWYESE